MRIRPPFKCHGGKYYLAPWIISLFPQGYEKMTYVEPFLGGGSVFLQKNASVSEHLSDIDATIIAIWKIIFNDVEYFIDRLKEIPYARNSFEKHANSFVLPCDPYIDVAIREYVLRRMSRGGLKKAFAWSERQRGGKPGDQNAWETSFENLRDIAMRAFLTHNLTINPLGFNCLLHHYDNPFTLIYCDPPYLHSTRVSKNAYSNEMTSGDHYKLSEILKQCKGKVLISGYASHLYDKELFPDWNRFTKYTVNHSSQTGAKGHKVEVVWRNF